MAHLGGVSRKDDLFFAKVDTQESGVRYKMEGPLRSDEQEAFQDLHYIRSCSEGETTRAEGLHSMKLAAKELRDEVKADAQATKLGAKDAAAQAAKKDRDEAKAPTRGVVKAEGAAGRFARIRYIENGMEKEICGPLRRSERRAQIDLDKLRAAAQGKEIQTVGFAAMRAKNQELHEVADMENRVAFGSAQYHTQRVAHKTDDSDPESNGDADDGYVGDDWLFDTDFTNPATVKKLFPPPAPKAPRPPPKDAEDATQQLHKFWPDEETPAALRGLLNARADPNVSEGGEVEPLPMLPEVQRDLLNARIDPNKFMRKIPAMTPLMAVIALAREEHLEEMRDVLVDYGANYGPDERRDYRKRWQAIRYDPIYLREFHRSAQITR